MKPTGFDRDRDRVLRPVPVVVVAAVATVFFLAAAAPAEAQSPRGADLRAGSSELWIERHARLEPVTSVDFGGGAGARPEQAPESLATSLGGRGRLTTGFAAPPVGPSTFVVRREVDGLWRVRSRGPGAAVATRVDYDFIGANGEPGVLSHVTDDRSVIPVRVVELPQRVRERPGGGATVEGGVMLEMDLARAREAGGYGGTLLVTVVQL